MLGYLGHHGFLGRNHAQCEYYDDWREMAHVPELPDNPMLLDQRTYRLDEPGDTVTVDPRERSDLWIRPDSSLLSRFATTARGVKLDRSAVERVAVAAADFQPDFETYMPTVGDLDRMPKYSRRGFQCWRGADKDRSREGKLPAYLQLIYDGALPDKNARQIEWEQMQAERRIGARLHDCKGWCR